MASWVAVLSLLVKVYPLPRALQIVSTRRRLAPVHSQLEQDELASAIDALLAINVLVFKPVCWKRAAVLHRYLTKKGIDTRIVFGVRRSDQGVIDGHAWLEANGEPILEAELPNYVVTYVYPSSQPFDLELATISGDRADAERIEDLLVTSPPELIAQGYLVSRQTRPTESRNRLARSRDAAVDVSGTEER